MAQPLFDPKTFSYEQLAGLNNMPGQSLSQSNTPAQLLAAQKLSPNIPITKVDPANPLGIKNPEPTTDIAGAVVAGAEAEILANQNLLEGEDTELDKEVDTAEDKYSKDLEGLEGRGKAQAAEEEARGLEDKNMALSNINAEILRKTAEFNLVNAQNRGRVQSTSSLQGQNAQARILYAAEIGMLQATALGMQGQVDAAQKAADRAVDLKYEDIETKLKIQKEQLDLLTGKLTKEEKLRADAVKLYLDEKEQEAADAKANDKTFNMAKINALGNGMPVSVAQKAQTLMDAGRTDEAYALMSAYDTEGGGSSNGNFTDTQINSGAAAASISIDDFKKLDEDSKNFFINRKSDINKQKEAIANEKDLGTDPRELEDKIQEMDVPEAAKDMFVRYLQDVFSEEYEGFNAPPEEEEEDRSMFWWLGF